MTTPKQTLPSPDISDVMNLLYMMKKQNEEILAKNEEILAKLNSIEEDNRKLRQELHEIKNYHQNHRYNVKVSSRKRDDPEDEATRKNEHSNNKKAKVSVVSLPEPELGHILEPPASFNTLDDDCLGNVLYFVGKKCYSVFGHVNKRCHEMFCSKGLTKETYIFGYGPLRLIKQQGTRKVGYNSGFSKGVLHYNRRDIFEWLLTDESYGGYSRLNWLCDDAIQESRLDILLEVFQRANERQLERLRECGLCWKAALYGELECMKFLRENECEWSKFTWYCAKQGGHDYILQYMQDNGYPTKWQD